MSENSILKRKKGNKIKNPRLNIWWNSTIAYLPKQDNRQEENGNPLTISKIKFARTGQLQWLKKQYSNQEEIMGELCGRNHIIHPNSHRFKATEGKSCEPIQHICVTDPGDMPTYSIKHVHRNLDKQSHAQKL